MLYLETSWASLIPFARVADLLKEVMPVGDSANQETVRNHLQVTAERIEQDLGAERQLNLFEGSEEDGYPGATEQKTRLRIQATSSVDSPGLRSGRNSPR
jgi:hypothetical protein